MGLGSSKTGQLNNDELELVKSSWEVVMEKPEENGVLIFKTQPTQIKNKLDSVYRNSVPSFITTKFGTTEFKRGLRTWKTMKAHSRTKKFLDRHNYYSNFKKFSGLPINELPKNKIFRKHAASIIQAINNLTLHLGNDSLLKHDLNALGKMHRMKNVTEQQFEELKRVLLDILEKEFKLTIESLKAWNKTLDIAFVYIIEGLQQHD